MVGLALLALAHVSASIPRTTPFEFARVYITQLGNFEDLRKSAADEADQDKGDSKKVTFDCVHSGTRYDLEVTSAIRAIQPMRLDVPAGSPLADLPQKIAQIYKLRQGIMQSITSICSAFAEGPKASVDYAALAAELPKRRAQLDYVDQTAMESAVLVFGALISDKPDSEGNASNLVLTCPQRDELLHDVEASFTADELKLKNPPLLVGQAQLFDEKLKEFNCSK